MLSHNQAASGTEHRLLLLLPVLLLLNAPLVSVTGKEIGAQMSRTFGVSRDDQSTMHRAPGLGNSLTVSALGAVCSSSGEKEASETCSVPRFPASLRKASAFLHTHTHTF